VDVVEEGSGAGISGGGAVVCGIVMAVVVVVDADTRELVTAEVEQPVARTARAIAPATQNGRTLGHSAIATKYKA
jgi:hypothetical protein